MVASVWSQGMIYKAVLQTVLLYESDSWVVRKDTLKVLERFHHQVDQKIAGIPAWQVGEEIWKWEYEEKALETTELCHFKENIWRRQDNIAEYITNLPIYELCKGAERIVGSIRFIQWWYQ